jgi:predicted DNA-binding transcriptional regulator AlpA
VRFIRPPQALEMIGMSRSTLRRMVQEGSFLQGVRITKRNAGYALEAVMEARTQEHAWEAASAGVATSRTRPLHRGRSKLALAQPRQAVVTVRPGCYLVRTISARTLGGSVA